MSHDANDPRGFIPSRELVKRVSDRIDVPRYVIDSILNALSEEIAMALRDNSLVKIKGIVTLRLKTRPASDMYSPREGKKIHIPERTVITAEASKSLKNMVNNIENEGGTDDEDENENGSVSLVNSAYKNENNAEHKNENNAEDNDVINTCAHDVSIASARSAKNDNSMIIANNGIESETQHKHSNDDATKNDNKDDNKDDNIVDGKIRNAVYTNLPRMMVNKNGFKRGHRLVLSLGSSFGVGSGDVTRPSSDSQTDENHGDGEDEEDHNGSNGKTGTAT